MAKVIADITIRSTATWRGRSTSPNHGSKTSMSSKPGSWIRTRSTRRSSKGRLRVPLRR